MYELVCSVGRLGISQPLRVEFCAHLVAVSSQEDSLIHAGPRSLGRAVSCAIICFFYCFLAHVGLVGRFGLMCAGWESNRLYYDAVTAR